MPSGFRYRKMVSGSIDRETRHSKFCLFFELRAGKKGGVERAEKGTGSSNENRELQMDAARFLSASLSLPAGEPRGIGEEERKIEMTRVIYSALRSN